MLYLRDLLPVGKKVKIEYRCDGLVDECGDTEDMLFGFAIWNGETLESCDGDNYYLYDIVEKYKWEDEEHLTIWIWIGWSGDKNESPMFCNNG